jgi:Fic family protein
MTYRDQLKAIIQAGDWSQERLAAQLNVAFSTLNAWLNERAMPRNKARANINELYLSIIGNPDITVEDLKLAQKAALAYHMTAQKLVSNKELLDKLTLHLTYHTNTIEGSTMTLADVENVLFDNKVLTNRTAIEQLEARNHQAALYWLLDEIVVQGKEFIITESLILNIHVRLMNGIIGDAGQYRKHSVRILGAHVALANWQRVPELIAQFIVKMQSSDNILEILAKSHATFEKIHPFSDGNGRTGRLLILALSLNAGYTPPLVIRERKRAYYKYLEIAQMKEDYRPLEFFLAQSMEFSGKLLASN